MDFDDIDLEEDLGGVIDAVTEARFDELEDDVLSRRERRHRTAERVRRDYYRTQDPESLFDEYDD